MAEQGRANKPYPSRSPCSRSGLLGRGRQRQRRDRANPRMPDLEGVVRVACLFVDRPHLHGSEQNSCLPRTLKVLPHQSVTEECR